MIHVVLPQAHHRPIVLSPTLFSSEILETQTMYLRPRTISFGGDDAGAKVKPHNPLREPCCPPHVHERTPASECMQLLRQAERHTSTARANKTLNELLYTQTQRKRGKKKRKRKKQRLACTTTNFPKPGLIHIDLHRNLFFWPFGADFFEWISPMCLALMSRNLAEETPVSYQAPPTQQQRDYTTHGKEVGLGHHPEQAMAFE